MSLFIPRRLGAEVLKNAQWYPVVSLTGPRQSGKSTLIRELFPDYSYVNLENPQDRESASTDPVSFIANRPEHLIIDEAQNVPEIFSMIQVVSDERGTKGQYILSGSQNFLMMKRIQQSLAGRVGMLKLLPFSYGEQKDHYYSDVDDFILRGGYPSLLVNRIDADNYFESYIQTYLTRDVTELFSINKVADFRKLLVLLASQVGSLLNISALSNALGLARDTVKDWLYALEQSYIIFMLEPYAANLKKRLTKTPKVYFFDTGLLCYLLKIYSTDSLRLHEHYGNIFENAVVADRYKHYLNQGKQPDLCFYRDDSKREIDLLELSDPDGPSAFEIKSSMMYRDKFVRQLSSVCDDIGIAKDRRSVILKIDHGFNAKDAKAESVTDFLTQN